MVTAKKSAKPSASAPLKDAIALLKADHKKVSGLFEQFHRSGGEDPEESGLGLGLFIVRSIVERHGGTVSLERSGDSRTHAAVHLPKEPPA